MGGDRMKESILKRYPGLKEEDVRLRDDGQGVYIEYWNSSAPLPSMIEINQWVKEDGNMPESLTELEQLKKDFVDLTFTLMLNGVI